MFKAGDRVYLNSDQWYYPFSYGAVGTISHGSVSRFPWHFRVAGFEDDYMPVMETEIAYVPPR